MNTNKPHKWRFLLTHPLAGIAFLTGRKEMAHRIQILETAKELWNNTEITQGFKSALDEFERSKSKKSEQDEGGGNRPNSTFGKWIWCCIRVFKPDSVIETGVSHGHSSRNILDAMHRNGKGKLYSIDLPNRDTNPDYNFDAQTTGTGWAVPASMRDRWELILGDARTELPSLLKRLGEIDIFFHDSDHSFEHMMFEFESALPYLSKSGIILSDDVDKNNAFAQFTQTHGLAMHCFNKGGVAIVPR